MPAASRELPYKIVGSVVPCSRGWLLVSAKLRGATFVPDFPRVEEHLHEAVQKRPAFTVVAIDAPVGGQEQAFLGGRRSDEAAVALLGHTVPEMRWGEHAAAMAHDEVPNEPENVAMWRSRYREIAEVIAPYLQRTIFECLPELSFYQLNGERPLLHRSTTEDGYLERRHLLNKVPGIQRVLDAHEPGVSRLQCLEAGVLLWTTRRIASRAAKRVPSLPEWDARGLRVDIVR
jgi:predicted RNase H-like nuclease